MTSQRSNHANMPLIVTYCTYGHLEPLQVVTGTRHFHGLWKQAGLDS